MTTVSSARAMKGRWAAPARAILDCVSTRTLPIVPAGRRIVERSESGASGVVLRGSDLSNGWYIRGDQPDGSGRMRHGFVADVHSRDSLSQPTDRSITREFPITWA
jgi:hypothetical protein